MRWFGIIPLLFASAAVGQQQQLRDWSPVDQTVSDYDPMQVSQRRVERGNAQFNLQYTMYEPLRPAQWSPSGLPTFGGAYGLELPNTYFYRFPGMTAFVSKPEYFVRIGPDKKKDLTFNKIPWKDGMYKDIVSANMVFNLIPELTTPLVPDLYVDWTDPRVNARREGLLDGGLNTLLDGQDRPADPLHDSRETNGWVDGGTYWLGREAFRRRSLGVGADGQVVDQVRPVE